MLLDREGRRIELTRAEGATLLSFRERLTALCPAVLDEVHQWIDPRRQNVGVGGQVGVDVEFAGPPRNRYRLR